MDNFRIIMIGKKMSKSKKDVNDKAERESKEDLSLDNEENKKEQEILADDLLLENQKLKDDYLRAFAEIENTKRRCQQEIDKNNKYAIANFAKALLPVADNLQRAIDAAEKEQNAEGYEGLLKGIELTQAELSRVFAKFDVKKMDIIGTVFDPNFHQVIQEVEDKAKPAGTIIAEFQTGYMIHDRILREAMVIVTK